MILNLRSCIPRAIHCSLRAKYNKLSPSNIVALPPVGISKICSLLLIQVIIYFSSISAALNQPPVLPPKIGENVSKFNIKLGDFLADPVSEGIANSLQIPLSASEIAEAREEGLDAYKTDDKGAILLDGNQKAIPKSKYPPYIFITDSYEAIDDFKSRTKNYLYKRVSKALTEDGIGRYERINILGAGNIQEFDFNNPSLRSVIKNNDVDSPDREMLTDEPKQQVTKSTSVTQKVKEILKG